MRSVLVVPAAAGLVLAASAAHAAVLTPTSVTTKVPVGAAGTDAQGAHVDDVLLDMLSFSGADFASSGSFASVAKLEVLSGRENINAEWGDADDGADGDPNPFVKAGLASGSVDPALQETTDPSVQDPALLNAFNSLSLTEMSDGEKGGDFSFKVMFAKGLQDDQPGVLDGVPELIFFERGLNDDFTVEVMTGGSFADPVYSSPYALSSADFGESGVEVNTTEIDSRQMVGVGGLDLDLFGMTAGQRAYGFRLSVSGAGPDLNGFFLSAEDPARFEAPLEPVASVPVPGALPLLALGLAALATIRRARG